MVLERQFNLKLEVKDIKFVKDRLHVIVRSIGDKMYIQRNHYEKVEVNEFILETYKLNDIQCYDDFKIENYEYGFADFNEIDELRIFFGNDDTEFYKILMPMIIEFAKENNIPNEIMSTYHDGFEIGRILETIGNKEINGVVFENDINLQTEWRIVNDHIKFKNIHIGIEYIFNSILDIPYAYIEFAKEYNSTIRGKYDWSLLPDGII